MGYVVLVGAVNPLGIWHRGDIRIIYSLIKLHDDDEIKYLDKLLFGKMCICVLSSRSAFLVLFYNDI